MRARALALADDVLAPEGDDGGADSPAEIAELLRWLADARFTFLGFREYDLETGPDGMALTRGARHRARHPAARQASGPAPSRPCLTP